MNDTLLITIKSYLDRLKSLEERSSNGNPDLVPTHEELAELLDVHPTTFSRMVNNKRKDNTLIALGKIITELRRRGFDVDVDDLLEYPNDA